MKTKIKVIVVIIISLLMLVGGLFFAINSRKETIQYFYDSGYVINNTYDASKVETNKEYFESNIAYQSGSNNDFSFRNTDGKKVTVSEESFVHYSNGSIMALKDGVAIDLEKIDLEILNYYNISDGSILSKKDSAYQINNLDDTITFNKMLFKISDSKYLLAADNIVISFSDGQTISTEDFVEIEYSNKDVIRLYNDKINYQTISSNLYILSDNIKIDVAYKTVSKNDVDCLAMVNMVINANDNIEVVEKKEEDKEDETNNDSQSGVISGGSGGSGGGNGSIGGNGNGNQGGGNTGDVSSDETIEIPNIINPGTSLDQEEETVFAQPKFNVTKLDVTTTDVTFAAIATVPEEVEFVEDMTVEIIQNSTGKKVVEMPVWTKETTTYGESVYGLLNHNDAYTINVRGSYKFKSSEEELNRVFVSKIFRTKDIGIEITKDYVTANSVSYLAIKKENSSVTGFEYQILKNSDSTEICSGQVEFGSKKSVVFPSADSEQDDCVEKLINLNYQLDSNSKYTIYVTKIFGGDQVNELKYTIKTLKKNDLSSLSLAYDLDMTTGVLKLKTVGTKDVDNGIKSYTYRVYDAIESSVENNEKTPILTRNVDSDKALAIDLKELQGKKLVYFNVEINYDDNEKTIIYKSLDSDSIEIGSSYPEISGYDINKKGDINLETLSGNLFLIDPQNFWNDDDTIQYMMLLKESTDQNIYSDLCTGQFEISRSLKTSGSLVGEYDSTIALPFHFVNVVPGRTYYLYLYVFENGSYLYLGNESIVVEEPDEIALITENTVDEKDNQNKPVFEFSLELDNKNENKSVELLDYIEIELYYLMDNEWIGSGFKTTIDGENLDLLVVTKNKIKLSASDFKKNNIEFTEKNVGHEKYTIVATGYGLNGKYKINTNLDLVEPFELDLNMESYVTLHYEETKTESKGTDSYELQFGKVIIEEAIPKIKYEIYELENGSNCNNDFVFEEAAIKSETLDEENGFSASIKVINGTSVDSKNLKRGRAYCIVYKGLDADGNAVTNVEYQLITPKRNDIKVSGYLSGYEKTEAEDKNKITFHLNVAEEEYDGAGDVYLEVNDTPQTGDIKLNKNEGTYDFFVDGLTQETKITLKLREYPEYSSGYDDVTPTIYDSVLYETTLFPIESVSLKNVRNELDTNSTDDGKMGGLHYTIEQTLGSIKLTFCFSSDTEKLNQKISGIRIKHGDGYSDIEKGELIKNGDTYEMPAFINLLDVKNNQYGDTIKLSKDEKTVTINMNNVKVIYDSNKISSDKNKYHYIVETKNKKYWNGTDFSNLYFSTGKQLTYKFPYESTEILTFNKDKATQIGYWLNEEQRVHYHEQIEIDTVKEQDDLAVVELPVTTVITTDEISVKYEDIIKQTSGQTITYNAKIKFSFNAYVSKAESENLKLKIGDNTPTSAECTSIGDNYCECTINTEIAFDYNFDKNYSILYDGKETYNNFKKTTNSNIDIPPIVQISDYSYTEDDGKWEKEKNSILFKKYISAKANVKEIFNSENISVEYLLETYDQSGNAESNSSCEKSEINSSWQLLKCVHNIAELVGEKKFGIIAQVSFENADGKEEKVSIKEENKQKSLVLRSDMINIIKDSAEGSAIFVNSENKFNVEMIDKDGTLVDCFSSNNLVDETYSNIFDAIKSEGKEPQGGLFKIINLLNNDKNYGTQYDLDMTEEDNKKMYYIILTQKTNAAKKEEIVAYSAIPFTEQSKSLNYKNIFEIYELVYNKDNYAGYLMYCVGGDGIVIKPITNLNPSIDVDFSIAYAFDSNNNLVLGLNGLSDGGTFYNNIQSIKYQIQYNDDTISQTIEKTRNNLNLSKMKNNNSTSTYGINLVIPIPNGGATNQNIKKIYIHFYDEYENKFKEIVLENILD